MLQVKWLGDVEGRCTESMELTLGRAISHCPSNWNCHTGPCNSDAPDFGVELTCLTIVIAYAMAHTADPATLTLEHWFAELDRYEERIPLAVLTEGLKRLRLDIAEIRAFLQFSFERYRRNLMHAGPAYHALILCWRSG